jgi:hypothetical protein
MNEVSHHLGNDSSSFHPVHSLIRAVGLPDLHHPKGRGRQLDRATDQLLNALHLLSGPEGKRPSHEQMKALADILFKRLSASG